jgi:hypothetical protein
MSKISLKTAKRKTTVPRRLIYKAVKSAYNSPSPRIAFTEDQVKELCIKAFNAPTDDIILNMNFRFWWKSNNPFKNKS